METPSEEQYYYQLPSGEVFGPEEIGVILREIEQGFISKDVLFSRGGDDHWVGLKVVELRRLQFQKQIDIQNDLPEKLTKKTHRVTVVAETPASGQQVADEHQYVDPLPLTLVIKIIGWVIFISGVISFVLIIAQESILGFAYLFSGLLSLILFLALAEIVAKLREIARSLAEINGKTKKID